MTHELWSTLNDKMYEYLSSVSLADLVASQKQRGEHVSVLEDKRAERPALTETPVGASV